jgi:Flp pilus assembly protein TadG
MVLHTEESGHALIELAMMVTLLTVVVLAVIDFSRATYAVEVLKNLAGEGSSMASRGMTPIDTATKVVNYAGNDLNMSTKGCVIVTAVTCQTNPCNGGGANVQVTSQASKCGITAASKIGCLKGQGGCNSSNATIPSNAGLALQLNQSLYITEVFYKYNTVTPLPKFMGNGVLPSQLYSAAYY